MSLPAPNHRYSHQRPVRVAIANDYPLVIAGTARALEKHPEWVTVVEYDSGMLVKRAVDVVLFDSFAESRGAADMRARLLSQSSARVVIFTWHTDPGVVAACLRAGAAGVVSKTVSPGELWDALRRVHRGERVTPRADPPIDGCSDEFGRWPGDKFGLSSRESEVLALICQGLSNKVIGESIYLGANTIKTYVRSLYRKIGAESRSQAMIWGMSNGFEPEKVRAYPN